MTSRLLPPLALIALIALSAPSAAADCCASPQPHHRHHAKRHDVKPFYVVEQGPVYGGPGIVNAPQLERFHTRPAPYPHMRETYSYPTYRDSYLVAPSHQPWQRGWQN